MSNTEHTPGPWRANSSWIEGPRMALRVACVDWPKRGTAPKTKGEAEANARLIAAAPDLLSTLTSLTNNADGLSFREDDIRAIVGNTNWNVLRRIIDEARAIIAKAEGRA